MNTRFNSNFALFQDRQLPADAPRNSWQQLTAGDEQAERFEGILRGALVVSLFCSVFLCVLRLQPAADAADDSRLALPTVRLQQVIGQLPAAVQAKVSKCRF